MIYLDRRYELLQTFRGTLYHPTNAEFPIKQQIAEKIAGSGISYRDLKNVFEKFGAKGLVGVLSLPPSSTISKAPRVHTYIHTYIYTYIHTYIYYLLR